MDQSVEQPSQQPEWFENFIANYDTQNPKVGDILQATIIRKDQDGIFLDLGLKREIMVPARDLEGLAPELQAGLESGNQIPVMVISEASENREMDVSVSRGLEEQIWEKAQKCMDQGEILNLEVVDHNRGGLIVRYENLRGFVPYSLIPELRGIRNPKRAETIKSGMVGKSINLKITEVDAPKRRLILSAESAQAEKRQELLLQFKKGQIISGKVVKILDFGAFIDLGGIDGLVHISQLSWKKVKHPSEVLSVGEEVQVKVIEVDRERQRIGLSRKALLPGPWQTLPEEVSDGDYIEGVITRIVDFGAFAKIPQGVEGLIHTSQIGYSAHLDPQSAVKPGDRVLVKVLEIKPERKRIALSMRQVPMERQIAWAMEKLEPIEEEPAEVSPVLEEQTTAEISPLLEEQTTAETSPLVEDQIAAVVSPMIEEQDAAEISEESANQRGGKDG